MIVDAWRESGEFAGRCVNKGSGKKGRWFYLREAVLDFAQSRQG